MPPGYRSIVELSPSDPYSQQSAESPRIGQLVIRSIYKGRGQIAGAAGSRAMTVLTRIRSAPLKK
eukprot:417384-Pelagomonas_calceolata.AAC.5